VASAHGRGHHRHHHHAKAHHARLEHFGAPANTSPSGDQSAPGDAGRVASFTNGVLTITLADGSTVSGNVTSDTEINCMAQGATASRDGGGDQGGQSGDQQGSDQPGNDQGDDNGQGDDDGGQQSQQPSCGTADLVAGALVHEAILKLGGNGAEFKLVLLDQQQAGS
jgi:hypothetical protein